MSKLILLLVGLVVVADAIVLYLILRRRREGASPAGEATARRPAYEPIDP
jgi:hypothetical protein